MSDRDVTQAGGEYYMLNEEAEQFAQEELEQRFASVRLPAAIAILKAAFTHQLTRALGRRQGTI